jgi:hypothetical protein
MDGRCSLDGLLLSCSEQAIWNAIAVGGGRCTFDCEGPTTLITEKEITIDNDVAADGKADLTLVVSNRTVSHNTSEEGASGIFNVGTATMTGSTVAGNNLAGGLGDIRNAGFFTAAATLLDGSCTTLSEEVRSDGYTIESPGDTCGFDAATDQVNVAEEEPNLRPLADSGGHTMTHAWLPASAAIDSIPSTARDLGENQRGAPRPEPGGSLYDVGAFELQEE